jgi:hypothetical protein
MTNDYRDSMHEMEGGQIDETPVQIDVTPVAVIVINSDLRKRVRIRVAQLGTTIKSFCEDAILNHLDSQDDHK